MLFRPESRKCIGMAGRPGADLHRSLHHLTSRASDDGSVDGPGGPCRVRRLSRSGVS